MRIVLLTAFVLALLALTACTNSEGPLALAPGSPNAAPASAPDLRALPSLPAGRHSSGLLENSLDGNQTFSRSASTLEAPPLLQISSGAGELSWAIWELPATDELRYLDIAMTVPPGEQAWLTLADYSTNRWQLEGPVVSGRVLSLDPLKHSSPGGQLYAAVLVSNGSSVSVGKLSLLAFHSNAAPSAALTADLTNAQAPVSIDFDASGSTDSDPGDSIVRYYWDFNADGQFETVTFEPLALHQFTEAGVFDVEVVVEDKDGATDSATVQITITPANQPPVAGLTILPNEVNKGAQVVLDASTSFDLDGEIVSYMWDHDGNGAFDVSTETSSFVLSTFMVGQLPVRVRVTDDQGGSAEASALLRVHGFDFPHNFSETEASSALESSMVLVEGLPAIVFSVSDTNQLKYTRALNDIATNWTTPIAVNAPGDYGQYCSLQVINGHPAVAWFNDTTNSLDYVRASDELGAIWGAPVTLTGADLAGPYACLREVNGRPAVSFLKYDSQDLGYVRASDADGTAWGAPQYLDTANTSGYFTSMQVLAGVPAIAYQDLSATDLRIILALDVDGDAWGSPVNIDAGAVNAGQACSLAVIGGIPAVAYRTGGLNAVTFCRATNIDGSSWFLPVQVDNTGADTGGFISLCEIEGNPAVAYYDATNKDLRYMKALDSNGYSWPVFPAIVDGQSDTGRYCNMLQYDSGPAICYYDDTFDDLKYVQGF
ncbi:PKD domain-containing protein [bacterium]|nr:PKD domain-containing protein [bacterium]